MSIKLEKEKKEKIKQTIIQSINNSKYELECIIGGNYNLGSNISFNQFKKIISRINGKKEFITKTPSQKLLISFPYDSKFRKIRVIIVGFKSINDYCNNENLETIFRNVFFEKKSLVNAKINKVYINDYNLKFNQKIENELDVDSTIIRELMREWKNIPKVFRYKKIYQYISKDGNYEIDCSIVKSSNFEDSLMTVKEVLEKDLFNKVIKPTDEKLSTKEWWKKTSKNLSNKASVRKTNVYYKNIKDSNVFENEILYEVEVEYIGNKKPIKIIKPNNKSKLNNDIDRNDNENNSESNNLNTKKIYIKDVYENSKNKEAIVNNIFSNIFGYIGIVLQCVQDSFYIISNKEEDSIYKDFIKLTNIRRSMDNMFFGPLPIDLNKNKLIQYQDNIYEDLNKVVLNGNILLDYSVTDKSDGNRALLFISSKGNLYLVGRDSNCIIRDMGVNIKEYANSIFDGEYIESDSAGNFINSFYIFDVYFYKGKNVMNNILGTGKKETDRLFLLNQFVKFFDEGEDVEYINQNLMFKIYGKTFLFGALSSTTANKRNYNLIFEKSKELLNKMNEKFGGFLKEGHLYPYNTDGLIFTPINLTVQQTNLNNKVPPAVQTYPRRWENVYKWKDNNHLTIDFRIEFQKNLKTNTREYIFINNQKYLKGKLKCRNYDSYEYMKKSNISECSDITFSNYKFEVKKNIESDASSVILNNNTDLRKLPGELDFFTSNPFLGKRDILGNLQNIACDCLLPVINEEIKCQNGDIIHDNQVIEFSYNTSLNIKDNELRWVPEKIRPNKFPNALNTCLSVWNLIHNPVDKETVSSGLNPELENNKYSLNYYLIATNYHTNPVKKFNNFCVSQVYDKYITTLSSPDLLDLGCGKMGDFFKYVNNNVRTCVGIDINADGLNNKLNGAASRIINNRNNSPSIKKLSERTLLILGDVSKSMNDGELALDESGRYYLDILYGKHKPSSTFNKKHTLFYNMSVNGFHVVTSKYVVHYVLNNLEDTNTYFENVSSNLKDQGFFIGFCLDGNMILNELNNTNNKVLEGKIDGNVIWSISRDELNEEERRGLILDNDLELTGKHSDSYDTTSPHLLGPGNKINVYFETFNMKNKENLVDIKYLEKKGKEYGLKLIETRLFTEEPGNMLSEFGLEKPDSLKELNKEDALLKWASYQRFFVFQKVASMNSE